MYHDQGLALYISIMEIIWERGVDYVSSLKIPQLKNIVHYHYFYDE